MADRDPDTIKAEIDEARDQLALTVDHLAARANPRRLADDLKAGVVRFVTRPPVAISLAGTLFFTVPTGEARGQVALFLGLTMLPFAIVAPLIGPPR